MVSNLCLRLETPEDFRTVEELTREAFWNQYQLGCDEHYLQHKLRQHPDYLVDLSYLAVLDDKIVGCIVYSKSVVKRFDGTTLDTVTIGPISVHPDYQGKGIGTALIQHTAKIAKEKGYPAIIIYGDPKYYSRVGFRLGEKYDLRTAANKYAIALQVLILQDDDQAINLSGQFEESSAFYELNATDVEAFDATFPAKEKVVTAAQHRFQVLVSLSYPVIKMAF